MGHQAATKFQGHNIKLTVINAPKIKKKRENIEWL